MKQYVYMKQPRGQNRLIYACDVFSTVDTEESVNR